MDSDAVALKKLNNLKQFSVLSPVGSSARRGGRAPYVRYIYR